MIDTLPIRTFLSAANINIHCMSTSSSDVAVGTIKEAALSSSAVEVGNVDGPSSRGEIGLSQEEGTCIYRHNATVENAKNSTCDLARTLTFFKCYLYVLTESGVSQ